jgi:uncharacterized protein
MSAENVAECAYKGFMKNKEITVPGFRNRILEYIPVKLRMIAIAKIKRQK